MDVAFTIGCNIRKYRTDASLSQSQLASELCVSPQAVSKWERGLCCPDVYLLPQLARLFSKSIDELFKNFAA
ncbi:MAG: helix-turn-helix transcriptional regulator [Eubacteriales bacterium]|nr:helix-turn-helix transcriptional regulator [Eubacterium sp.]MDD7179206.1 helix-turn-helix transcriptional regulator [Eubacterium sp.]MDY5493773.1 helix-turn-helix transcriptional regulator [Eubacteriales bacterium]